MITSHRTIRFWLTNAFMALPLAGVFIAVAFIAGMTSPLFAACLLLLANSFVYGLRAAYENSLLRRIDSEHDYTWRIHVEGVDVGCITDRELAELELTASQDGLVLYTQFLNVCLVGINACLLLFKTFPLMVFWIFALLYVGYPANFAELIVQMQHASTTEILNFSSTITAVSLCLSVTYLGCALASGHSFEFKNLFSESVRYRICGLCGVAAGGVISLTAPNFKEIRFFYPQHSLY